MALFSYSTLKNLQIDERESYDYLARNHVITEASQTQVNNIRSYDSFDIFLSHSYQDREIIPHLKKELENFGFSVYVDWINDRLLSRESVNKNTAKILQIRMQQSKSLVYATSSNQRISRWMPWELGYFDGIKDKMVAILPIKTYDNNFKDDFKGEEYLGLYYYVDKGKSKDGNTYLWVWDNRTKYVRFNNWLTGEKPTRRS